jgi:hypothetical protein
MKKQQIVCVLIMLLCISFNGGHAQQRQTAYEKKKDELIVIVWAKFGQDGARYVSPFSDKTDQEVYKSVEGIDAAAILLGRYTIGMQSMKWYATELKKLERLKTTVDFNREEERANYIKTQREEEIFGKTDIGSIKNNIKLSFKQWNQKGEFEKESDYTIRLKNQSQNAFDSICTDKIQDKIKDKDSYDWEKNLSAFNSESEYFTITFNINNFAWQNNINIPIANAPNFKNDWNDLKIKIDDYDWCFVNNNLCPIFVTLETYDEKSKYKFPVSLQNQSDILYEYDDLKIENPYLSGYIYKYTNARAIAEQQIREKQRLDSLELAKFFVRLREKQRLDSLELAKFNVRLDSIFNAYNRQLLQNSHNIGQLSLKGYNKIAKGEDRMTSFNISVSSMEHEFENLETGFENERRKEYRENGSNVFSNESEFESFYIKGKDIYNLEVEKRKVLRSLAVYSKTIEIIDLKKEAKENIGSVLLSSYTGSNTNYEKINKVRIDILNTLKNNQNKQFYSQIIDFVVETNKDLNTKWTKNGQYFKSKVEFFNAFLSTDYKMILKNNKQKTK